jgi:hypothetical protein
MINAIVWSGKGNSGADWFKPVQFETRQQFEEFKSKTDDVEAKYWTVVREFTFSDQNDDIPYNNYDGALD